MANGYYSVTVHMESDPDMQNHSLIPGHGLVHSTCTCTILARLDMYITESLRYIIISITIKIKYLIDTQYSLSLCEDCSIVIIMPMRMVDVRPRFHDL